MFEFKQVNVKEAVGATGDHEAIQGLFPSTYGRPRVELSQSTKEEHTKT